MTEKEAAEYEAKARKEWVDRQIEFVVQEFKKLPYAAQSEAVRQIKTG